MHPSITGTIFLAYSKTSKVLRTHGRKEKYEHKNSTMCARGCSLGYIVLDRMAVHASNMMIEVQMRIY